MRLIIGERRYCGFFVCHDCQTTAVHRRDWFRFILRFLADQGQMHDGHRTETAWTR